MPVTSEPVAGNTLAVKVIGCPRVDGSSEPPMLRTVVAGLIVTRGGTRRAGAEVGVPAERGPDWVPRPTGAW